MTATQQSAAKTDLYRKAALEQHGSPERLNEMISITRPTAWIALSVVGLILCAAVTWACIGRLPTHVTGNGLLLTENGRIYEVVTAGTGTLRELSVHVGDAVEAGQVIAVLAQPDAERELRLAREQVVERTKTLDRVNVFAAQEIATRRESEGRQTATLDLRVQLGRQRESALRQRLRLTEGLYRERIVTQSEVLGLQQDLSVVLQEISSASSERARLAGEQVELARTAAQRIQDAELALSEATRRVTGLAGSLADTSTVVAPVTGEVKEMRALPGAQMRDRQPLLTIESKGDGLEALVFIRSTRNGTRVQPGMSVRVAPSNARREEFGTLVGKVVSVSDFPVSVDAVRALISNDDLARSFMSNGPPYKVLVRLQRDPATSSGYTWTSSRGAGITLDSGITLEADITVELRRPIEMVIPALRDLLSF